MKKKVEQKNGVIAVSAAPDDAAAQLRRRSTSIRQRLASGQPFTLSNAERDLNYVALAQRANLL
jgi:hypothetical protein